MMNKKIIEGRKQLSDQEIFNIIEQITPLNNRFRDLSKNDQNGTDALSVMWEVGDLIKLFVEKNKIKPHTLYWRIYGKAEGLKNSYITRDFLSYCLRINQYFKNKVSIYKKFPYLKKYSLFREAFPLLENRKFKLSKNEEGQVVKLLNSNDSPKKIKRVIKLIKARRIGIKNTRTQKLIEMKPITDNFVSVYNLIYSLIKNNDQQSIKKLDDLLGKDLLIKLSQIVAGLTQENLYIPQIIKSPDLDNFWSKFIDNLLYLTASSVEIRNRFRRLVPPKKLFELADMINAFTTDTGVATYRKRRGLTKF